MNDELTPIEEQALDAMLAEALADKRPPDLSSEILQRLHDHPLNVNSLVRTDEPKRHSQRPLHKEFAIAVAVFATLAASILMVIWLRADLQLPGPSQSIVAVPHDAGVASDVDPFEPTGRDGPPSGRPLTRLADTTTRQPPRGIPLAMGSPPDSRQSSQAPLSTDQQTSPESGLVEAVTLVSQQVDSQLYSYWDAIGIEPSSDAATDEIVDRLMVVLGVELPSDSLDDPERLRDELTSPIVARAIAESWLRQISEGGVSRLDQQTREALIDDLAACFQAEQGFDRTLSGWIGGQNSNASAFYRAISSDHHAMARRLAALTMNIDLRCTRCHESYIEGNGRQSDYWAYAAFLNRGVTRGPQGQVKIDAPATKLKPYFYELSDGRQRVVEPAIPSTWAAGPSDQSVAGVGEWAKRLIGSPELAEGVVNSLWQLVYDQPLHGRVVDPFSAPHHESLDRLEDKLVQDLIRSRFDVARTLALIIASPATKRSVPQSLRPENLLVADEAEIRKAESAVNAFAAAVPVRKVLPLNQRLDMAMRAIGGKLDADGRTIVAQIGSSTDRTSNSRAERSLSNDFPDRGDSYPVQWLTQIEDQRSRVEHLAYLAGYSRIPNGVFEAAQATRAANVSDELTFHRVWWLLRQ